MGQAGTRWVRGDHEAEGDASAGLQGQQAVCRVSLRHLPTPALGFAGAFVPGQSSSPSSAVGKPVDPGFRGTWGLILHAVAVASWTSSSTPLSLFPHLQHSGVPVRLGNF